MAAKSEVVSTAAKEADLDKAYASALKAMSVLGIKMSTKKPNAGVLGPLMTSTKKKAEFCLVSDGGKVSLVVQVDKNKNTLGIFDLKAEKDLEKRVVLYKSLVASGLMDKSDLEKLQAEIKAAQGPDPKVLANAKKKIDEINKVIKTKEAEKKTLAALPAETALKDKKYFDNLVKFTKKALCYENVAFVLAVAAKMDGQKIYDTFIAPTASSQVNLPSGLQADIESAPDKKKVKYGPAAKSILGLIQSDTMPRFRAALIKVVDEEIKELQARIEEIEDTLAKAAA